MTNSTWHVVIVTSVPGLALAPCQHPWNNKTLVVARTPLGPPTLASLLSVLLCGEVLVHGSARVPHLTHGCHSLGARALPGERQCYVCSVTGGHSRPVLPNGFTSDTCTKHPACAEVIPSSAVNQRGQGVSRDRRLLVVCVSHRCELCLRKDVWCFHVGVSWRHFLFCSQTA